MLQQDRGTGLQPIAYLSKKTDRRGESLPRARAGAARHHHGADHVATLPLWHRYTDSHSHGSQVAHPLPDAADAVWPADAMAGDTRRLQLRDRVRGRARRTVSRTRCHVAAICTTKDAPVERPPAFVDTKRTFELNRIFIEKSDELIDELRGCGRGTTPPWSRPTQCAAAGGRHGRRPIEAATRIIPEAEQPADRPAANRHGARVTPTQRCTADNKRSRSAAARPPRAATATTTCANSTGCG